MEAGPAFLNALPIGAGIALAALIGAIFGSFIATLVLRWPAGRSLAGRSRCDGCDAPLGARDLVPLLSALRLRGRCRRCGAPIDPFHGRVELASALIGALALAVIPGISGWLWALFGWLLLPLALLDARHMWLPDPLNALLAVAFKAVRLDNSRDPVVIREGRVASRLWRQVERTAGGACCCDERLLVPQQQVKGVGQIAVARSFHRVTLAILIVNRAVVDNGPRGVQHDNRDSVAAVRRPDTGRLPGGPPPPQAASSP